MNEQEHTMKTESLIPAIPVPAVKPKLSKQHVMAAMLFRAEEKHAEACIEYNAKMKALEDRAEQAAREAAMQRIASDPLKVNFPSPYREGDTFTISMELMSPALAIIDQEYRALRKTDPRGFNEAETKRSIRRALDTQPERIQLILSAPENVTVIDEALAKVFGHKQLAIEV